MLVSLRDKEITNEEKGVKVFCTEIDFAFIDRVQHNGTVHFTDGRVPDRAIWTRTPVILVDKSSYEQMQADLERLKEENDKLKEMIK